jgi:hypothetical protein
MPAKRHKVRRYTARTSLSHGHISGTLGLCSGIFKFLDESTISNHDNPDTLTGIRNSHEIC